MRLCNHRYLLVAFVEIKDNFISQSTPNMARYIFLQRMQETSTMVTSPLCTQTSRKLMITCLKLWEQAYTVVSHVELMAVPLYGAELVLSLIVINTIEILEVAGRHIIQKVKTVLLKQTLHPAGDSDGLSVHSWFTMCHIMIARRERIRSKEE